MAKKAHPLSLVEAQMIAADMLRLGVMARTPVRRLDADETNMLALQLEQMRTRVYEDQYPMLKARMFFPVTTEVDPGAETFAFRREDYVGSAEYVSNGADDLVSVETDATKETYAINRYGNSWTYSIEDLQRAAFAGAPLSAKKAIAARRFWERRLDEVAAFGDSVHGIGAGALNDSNVAIEPLANAGTWATKVGAGNPERMLEDANAAVKAVMVDSKEAYMANRMLLPLSQYMLFSQTRLADTGETVLEAFLRANPGIQSVDSWNKLTGAGAGATDRLVVYQFDPTVAEIVIPQDFMIMPPQPVNLAFRVAGHGKTAGCPVLVPLAFKYMDGI